MNFLYLIIILIASILLYAFTPYRESWDSERKIAKEFRKINNGTSQDYDRMLQEAKEQDKVKNYICFVHLHWIHWSVKFNDS